MGQDEDPNRRRERLKSGWIDLQRRDDGWLVSWTPDAGHADYPGHTYTQHDANIPDAYPGPDDPDKLLAWGRALWGQR